MTYQVLARKWRPQVFDDVIGQSHVTRSLRHSLIRGSVAHAYILTGTRGIGKTTIARLLAKALRCLNLRESGDPCGECEACHDFETGTSMNVLEIDGASNNSVDNIRDLISNIQYLPSIGRKKVYIIDEVHMLSTSAFNALLKTLEEPPAHVVFILATTEPQKLLGTVLSRCVRFDLRHVTPDELFAHVKNISAKEGIVFQSDELIGQLCKLGKGSVRDTLSLLEQVVSFAVDGKIGEDELVISLGIARLSAIRELLSAVLRGSIPALRQSFLGMLSENVSPDNLASSLLDHLYQLIQHVDDPIALENKGLIDPRELEAISTAELFWLYETLSKDVLWCLKTLNSEKALELVLQKLALRKEFFSEESKKKLKNEAPAPIQKEKPKWNDFLGFVSKENPALATNLEQGNLLDDFEVTSHSIKLRLGFSKGLQVFHDHLSEEEVVSRVVDLLASFYKLDPDRISLEVVLIDDGQEEEFRSVAEIKAEDEEQKLSERKRDFLNQPILQEARKLFNADIDKVILNKK